MKVGVARETAHGERRVALVPEALGKLTAAGCEILVEAGAGAGAMIPDQAFTDAGGTIVSTADLYATADVILHLGRDVAFEELPGGIAIVSLADVSETAIEARLMTALLGEEGCREAAICLGDLQGEEETLQRIAVRMLDAVCAALTPDGAAVVS